MIVGVQCTRIPVVRNASAAGASANRHQQIEEVVIEVGNAGNRNCEALRAMSVPAAQRPLCHRRSGSRRNAGAAFAQRFANSRTARMGAMLLTDYSAQQHKICERMALSRRRRLRIGRAGEPNRFHWIWYQRWTKYSSKLKSPAGVKTRVSTRELLIAARVLDAKPGRDLGRSFAERLASESSLVRRMCVARSRSPT